MKRTALFKSVQCLSLAGCLSAGLALIGCGGGSGGASSVLGASERAPKITSIAPNSGPTTGGEHVVVSGSGFTQSQPVSVYFGNQPAADVVVVSPATITCVTPPHAAGRVGVRVADGTGVGVLPAGFAYTTGPSVLWLDYIRVDNRLAFQWQISRPVDEIIVFRGRKPVATLEGDAESLLYTETDLGYYRYTVALYEGGVEVDQRSVMANIGRIVWDPPSSSPYTGYYLYIGEAVHPDPREVLPYENPTNFSLDVSLFETINMEALYRMAFIDDAKTYYLALSSYYQNGSSFEISPLSEALKFSCDVKVNQP